MDASTIRLILIVVGVILIVALYLWERRREQHNAYHDDYADDDLFEDENADEPYGVRPTRHALPDDEPHQYDDVDRDAGRSAAPPAAKRPGLWQRLRGRGRAAPVADVADEPAFDPDADADYDPAPPIRARAAFAQTSNPARPKTRRTSQPLADADAEHEAELEPVRPVKSIKPPPPEPAPKPEPTPRPRPAPEPEPEPPPPPASSKGVKRREVTVPDPLLIQFSVSARRYPFKGPEILEVASGCGLHPGEMDIFHCFDTFDDEIRVYFSMANMVKPGRFPFKDMDGFSTPGLVLFAQLEGDPEDMTILDEMLATARKLALSLNGDVLDSTRRPLTVKKEEELRQAVLENERRWRRVPRQ